MIGFSLSKTRFTPSPIELSTRRMSRRSRLIPLGSSEAADYVYAFAALAIHLAIHAIDKVVSELQPHYGANCPVALVMRATWPDEKVLTGTLGTIQTQLANEPMERTALILVGKALAAEDFIESSLYSTEYRRRFRSA